jgi:hypothetical protein
MSAFTLGRPVFFCWMAWPRAAFPSTDSAIPLEDLSHLPTDPAALAQDR